MSNPMTDTIEELERLLAAATEGPWSKEVNFYSNGATVIFGPKPEQVLISENTQFATDAALIVALRNAAPTLLASLKAVTAERDAMAEALRPFATACLESWGQRQQGEGPFLTRLWLKADPNKACAEARKALESSK